MLNIAHISDLHLDGNEEKYNRLDELLCDISDHGIDHLVITGDITNAGRDVEYKQAIRLFKKYGYYEHSRLSVIPGNHDLYPFFFRKFPRKPEWDDIKGNPKLFLKNLKEILPKLRQYSQSNYSAECKRFASYFKQSCLTKYPYEKNLSSNSALVGIDTNNILPTYHLDGSRIKLFKNTIDHIRTRSHLIHSLYEYSDNPLCCNGDVDLESVETVLKRQYQKRKTIIVVMHHYLYDKRTVVSEEGEVFAETMGIYQRNKLLALFKKYKVKLVLHGHWHITESYIAKDVEVLNGAGIND